MYGEDSEEEGKRIEMKCCYIIIWVLVCSLVWYSLWYSLALTIITTLGLGTYVYD